MILPDLLPLAPDRLRTLIPPFSGARSFLQIRQKFPAGDARELAQTDTPLALGKPWRFDAVAGY